MKYGYLSPKNDKEEYTLLSDCDTLYKDALASMPEFKRMVRRIKAGEEIVVINLWDIGDTIQSILVTIGRIRKKGAMITVLNSPWVNEGEYMDDLLKTLDKIREIKAKKRENRDR